MAKASVLLMRVKVAYSMGYIGRQMYYLINSYFLMYFYTNVAGISSTAAGVITLVARLWDAVNDPMMGALVDKTVSKTGKSLFYIKYFSGLSAIIFVLSYFCPEIGASGKVAWCTATYILQGMATTIINIPYGTLLVRMTDNGLERVRVGQFTLAFGTICNVVVPVVMMPLAQYFGGENMTKGFTFAMIVFSVLYFIVMQITAWGCKGYDETGLEDTGHAFSEDKAPKKDTVKKATVLETLAVTCKNKYTLGSCVAYLAYIFIAAIMGTSLMYYLQYNVGNVGMMGYYSTADGIGYVIAIFTMGIMYKTFGNVKTCAIGSSLMAIACLIRLVARDTSTTSFVIAIAVMGLGGAWLAMHIQQCIMESCDYGRLKFGIDADASIVSFFNFSQKLGQALGAFLVGVLTGMVPFDPAEEVQEQSVLNMFFAQNVWVPLALSVVSVLAFLFIVKYEREFKQMKAAKDTGN